MRRQIDPSIHLGEKYGRLTIMEFSHLKKSKKGNRIYYKCRCDCGNLVTVRYDGLKSGNTSSCGCYNKEINRERAKTLNRSHGLTNTRLYTIWCNMKARCYNPKNDSYIDYGARGIKICDGWLNDFKSFYDWAMSNGYKDDLTIDRIDHEGNYSPENCRWTDQKHQQGNRRDNIYITYTQDFTDIGKGKIYRTFTESDWAKIFGIDHKIIEYHLKHPNGRTINQILEYCMDFNPNGNGTKLGFIISPDMNIVEYPDKYDRSFHD